MAVAQKNEEKKGAHEIISKLFDVGAHFAYSRSRRHPSTSSYIFGAKNRVEIFDLEKTAELLENAKAFFKKLGKEGKTILFVAGKHEARQAVLDAAATLSMPVVAGRWVGGVLTNFSEIKKRIERLETLVSQREKGELNRYTKLERLLIDREIAALQGRFGGLLPLKSLPGALFIVDSKREHIACAEGKVTHVPIVALMNSDCDVKDAEYPILGNDFSPQSIRFFTNELVNAYQEGITERPAPVATPAEGKQEQGVV